MHEHEAQIKLRQKAEIEELQKIHLQLNESFSKTFSYVSPSHFNSKNYDININGIDKKDLFNPGIDENKNHPINDNNITPLSLIKINSIDTKIINQKMNPTLQPHDSVDERNKAYNSDKTQISSTEASPIFLKNSRENLNSENLGLSKHDKDLQQDINVNNDKVYKKEMQSNNGNENELGKKIIQEISTPEFLLKKKYVKENPRGTKSPKICFSSSQNMAALELLSKDEDFLTLDDIYIAKSQSSNEIKDSSVTKKNIKETEVNEIYSLTEKSQMLKKDLNSKLIENSKEEVHFENDKSKTLKRKEKTVEELENICKTIEVKVF